MLTFWVNSHFAMCILFAQNYVPFYVLFYDWWVIRPYIRNPAHKLINLTIPNYRTIRHDNLNQCKYYIHAELIAISLCGYYLPRIMYEQPLHDGWAICPDIRTPAHKRMNLLALQICVYSFFIQQKINLNIALCIKGRKQGFFARLVSGRKHHFAHTSDSRKCIYLMQAGQIEIYNTERIVIHGIS